MGLLILFATVCLAQDGFAPGEAWRAAQALPPGLERARAFEAALREARNDPEQLGARLGPAFQAFVEDHDAYRGEVAERIAQVMLEVDDRNWAAFCLEGISRRLGKYERADEVLVVRHASAATPAERLEIVERRALLAAGAGWRERELDLLGAAVARGGTDGYQILGRLALAAGDKDRARALFGVLVARHSGTPESEAQGPPWALRGWGLALLPGGREPLPPPISPEAASDGRGASSDGDGDGDPPRCNPHRPLD